MKTVKSKGALTRGQFIALSDLCREIGIVFFSTMVIAPFFVDKINWFVILSGGIAVGIFWLLSIIFASKEKNE